MTNKDKVIKGLECCKWSRQNVKPEKVKCDECPYKDQNIMNAYSVWRSCTNVLAGDALELLRSHKPKPILNKNYSTLLDVLMGTCPSCGKGIVSDKDSQTRFCRHCGQEVIWSD